MSHAAELPERAGTSALEITSILLLDDDLELSDALRELLETRNFVVTTVHDGAAGLRETQALDFDVIICDLMMPTLPGDLFYLAVKKLKPLLAERFIFVTGHAENPKVDSFLKSINGLVLLKPVLADDLLYMISLVLRNTKEAARTA